MSRAGFSSKCWRVLRWAGLAAAAPALWACTSRTLEAPVITPTATLTTNFTQKINNEIDILFMIDNSSSMTAMQQKLLQQLPKFMQVLEQLPTGLPSLHVGVVSSDMGALSDAQSSIGCAPPGNDGKFWSSPEGTCLSTTINPGDTFISDVDGVANFTDPIDTVFQCISLLGSTGCGFEHQLASIDHALGADNLQPDASGNLVPTPPSENAGFLRPEAYLGIVLLTNEDDCSAPANTTIYSLNNYQQNISNPDGPVQNYRCNGGPRGAHLCQDPGNGNAMIIPPLVPPADASGTPTRLPLASCEDNESGSSGLIPVSQFVNDIKALKPDPNNQILVAGIIAPPSPYAVEWDPEVNGINTAPGEVWPAVQHSCGPPNATLPSTNPDATQFPTDGSFGDPGVRLAQFMSAFPNFVQASICDPSYADSMVAIATKLGQLITPPCITGTIQIDPTTNQPACSVTEHLTSASGTQDRSIQMCPDPNNPTPPCWSLAPGAGSCTGQQLQVHDEMGINTNSESSTINCSICLPNSTQAGCPCPSGNGLYGMNGTGC